MTYNNVLIFFLHTNQLCSISLSEIPVFVKGNGLPFCYDMNTSRI